MQVWGGPTGGLGWAMKKVPRSCQGHMDGSQTELSNTHETHRLEVPGLVMSCGVAMGLFPWRGCGEISSHQSGATGCPVQAQGCLGETVTAGRPSSHLSALQLPLSSGQRGWVAV